MNGRVLSRWYGTRPLTHTGPKQQLRVANKPSIQYFIENLRDAGITDVGIILGNVMPEKVQESLGDGSRFGVRFNYIAQGGPKGDRLPVRKNPSLIPLTSMGIQGRYFFKLESC